MTFPKLETEENLFRGRQAIFNLRKWLLNQFCITMLCLYRMILLAGIKAHRVPPGVTGFLGKYSKYEFS